MENRIKLLAVCGPTASGKTALAIALAKALDGEIVSCDSMQIYRGMEIGTAKPTAEEMDGVPHHLLGFLDPAETFSAADYTALAGKAIRDIASRGKRPLLVGGTGLYARALLRERRSPKGGGTKRCGRRSRRSSQPAASVRSTRVCSRAIPKRRRRSTRTTQSA